MAYIGVSPSNGVRQKHTYTATASQTTFSGAGSEGVSLSYKDSNYVDVYVNGVKLGDADYTATSGTSIVLPSPGAAVNDIVEIITYDVFSVADTVSKADGGQFDGNVTMAGTLAVTGETTLSANLNLGDNDRAIFGAGDDLQIYHDGSNSIIKDAGTGQLQLHADNFKIMNAAGTENIIFAAEDGVARLFYDNSTKLSTTSTGIDVTGGFNATDGCTITTSDNTAQLTLTSTDTDADTGPQLILDRNSSSPADNDRVGEIAFTARNDANQTTEFAIIQSRIIDASDGTEDGRLILQNIMAGDVLGVMENNSTETVFNQNSVDNDFRVESDNDTHAFFLNGANGKIGLGTSSTDADLHIEPKTGNTNASLLLSNSGRTQYFRIENNEANDTLRFNANDLTQVMNIDSAGHVTMPKQPAFSAAPSADINNITGDATTAALTDVQYTEIFDNNGDFNANNEGANLRGTFTAPVTGKYYIGYTLCYSGVTSASTSGVHVLNTSNRVYNNNFNPYNHANVGVNGNVVFSAIVDMDANDTAHVSFYVNGNGSKVVDILASQHKFYGMLVG